MTQILPRAATGANQTVAAEPARQWFESDPLWFKKAVFYEIHIRGFADGNDDGCGDFRGLTEKLDYLQWLGIDCVWLLPMYPSPLRDGGYDIADFYAIHPDYGTVEDFRTFVDAAHQRGIRVIADLVMNHTSSDHPWFQEARSNPASPKRDWYVWSDTDERYRDARIIFIDTEVSNWTWDPVAGQYYWHRFFSHQPDLNYDNPEVQEAMLEVLHFWLDLGIDGFRLDAVPYLFEREGTNCENLPETHAYLKRVRAEIDGKYADRVLLAEANQWPAEVVHYFGDGDECHMAFQFPVMPRLFMGIRREEASPIVDILEQTPPIPDNAQWGLFLRNHDELTLEMVSEEERDYMWAEYAQDPRMKLNLGIRRRLAPLLDNGRDEVELLTAILFSLPGSPVIYYGDEIGMGDNVYLGDRDGVRTPMQWTGDRNGGFSRADFAQLYLPPLMDPVYGYQAVNVEAQLRTPTSLLRWLHRFVELRKAHPVLSLGSYEPLRPANPRILAHIRRYGDEIALCVHNLARSAQAAELDLSQLNGMVPEELFGETAFPRIGELPYLLTFGPRGFYWFRLRGGSLSLVHTESELLEFVRHQRWFGAKSEELTSGALVDSATLRDDPPLADALVELRYASGNRDVYQLVLGGSECDLLADPAFATEVLRLVREGATIPTADGEMTFEALGSMVAEAPLADVRLLGVEQSNSALVVDERLFVKVYRRLEAGQNPELELLRFLSAHGFRNVPELGGWWSYVGPAMGATLGLVQRFLAETVDGWSLAVDELARDPEASIARLHRLGEVVGEMHAVLASDPSDPAFAPEEASPESLALLTATVDEEIDHLFLRLPDNESLAPIAGRGDGLRHLLHTLAGVGSVGRRIRHHGDLHLGQVLWADGDWLVLDFEGEPARPLHERRGKASPLRDVAGMLRSFTYAAAVAGVAGGEVEERARAEFLDGYATAVRPSGLLDSPEATERLLRIFELEKAIYELRYELANRPDWVHVPVAGIQRLLDADG